MTNLIFTPGSPEAIALAHSIMPCVLLAVPFYCIYRAIAKYLSKS